MIYSWRCTGCEVVIEITRPMSESSVSPIEPCLCAAPEWVRVYEMPMVMKASFPDGHKRKGWADLKESAKLEKIAAASRPDTKREIKQEIKKMGIKPGND